MNINNKLEVEFYSPLHYKAAEEKFKIFFWNFPIWSGQPNKIVWLVRLHSLDNWLQNALNHENYPLFQNPNVSK